MPNDQLSSTPLCYICTHAVMLSLDMPTCGLLLSSCGTLVVHPVDGSPTLCVCLCSISYDYISFQILYQEQLSKEDRTQNCLIMFFFFFSGKRLLLSHESSSTCNLTYCTSDGLIQHCQFWNSSQADNTLEGQHTQR